MEGKVAHVYGDSIKAYSLGGVRPLPDYANMTTEVYLTRASSWQVAGVSRDVKLSSGVIRWRFIALVNRRLAELPSHIQCRRIIHYPS